MRRRRGICIAWSLRLAAAGVAALGLMAAPAVAQGLLPADFFNAPITPGGSARIEATTLVIDSATGLITASGDVVLHYQGYTARGQRLIYNRTTNDTRFVGPATIRDPSGNVLEGNDLEVTGGLRQAFIESLTITAYDGARITADSVEYDAAVRTLLTNARYAPCGECIDAEGRRIGWSIRASQFIQNNEDWSLEIVQPTLELLGVPVAWLPYLWLPDARGFVPEDMEMPRYDYSERLGHSLSVPLRVWSGHGAEVILTPMLMSRQGGLLAAEWIQSVEAGSFRIKASGVYQFDRSAFAGTVGDRDWRGAIQTSGRFTPAETWQAGWSYTAFTDAAYLEDYRLTTPESGINQVYATHLTADTYLDIRLQRFNRIGNYTETDQQRQGMALPAARFEQVIPLADGFGRVELSGRLLGVRRELDQTSTVGGVTHVHGFAGDKAHAMLQAGWQNQWIAPGGVLFAPYLGLRADAASYDGASGHALAPGATTLLSATPIAAMDVRWPLAASDGANVYLIEPVAQLVYRGSGESLPGITNDDAQSFVFEDTNLFSYNRFSGSDRQETGLRANLGARYLADFSDGSYVELIGGQSFHLAGANAFTHPDPAQPGATEALAGTASYAVLGAYAGFRPDIGGYESTLRLGGKLQVDPAGPTVTRAALAVDADIGGYTGRLDYLYEAANAGAGLSDDRHEVGGELSVPLMDYWRATAGAYWDLAANSWLQAGGGLKYDDGYLEFGASATVTGPTHRSPNDTRVTATFRLKAPAGSDIGYSGPVLLP